MRARTHGPFLLLATTLAAASGGCDGVIGDGDAPNGPTVTPTAECSPTADPIRRLTPTEYVNTATTLFPGVVLPTASPIPDSRVHGFTNQSAGQSISDLGVQRYEELAVAIGEAAAQQLDSWAPCSDDSDACAESLAKELAFRAYRRPLAPDEEAAVTGFALQARGDFGMTEGMAIVIQGLLESPSFLFRPEIGTATEEGATVPLDGYEMASRLSYFFLDTMPDDGLFAAAADGRLTTPEGVEAEARRLMAMPEARQVLTGFLGEWLGLYRLEALSLDSQVFPELDDQLRADLEASARAFLDKALWDDDSFESLYDGSFGFVNDRLAPLFGVPEPGSDELVLVELDPAQRRGILTQPALLAATSHGIAHSPILRGVTLLDRIACAPVPAPPPGILDDFDPVEVPPEEICTTRDQVAKTHSVAPACQSCHVAIDGAGFAFENYDALGRHRTEENGCSIDATGVLPGEMGEVSDGVDLSTRLSESPQAAECLAAHAFRFALGRLETKGDTCQIQQVAEGLLTEGKSLQTLLIDLVKSDAFRRRPRG